jgi:hypothetical protein
MDTARKNWNTRQKELRTLLTDPARYLQGIDLFLQQHAEVHAGIMSSVGSVSFEDEVINDMADYQLRCVPDRMDHSIIWIIWHLARIEDVTMNMLVAGRKQVFETGNWSGRLNSSLIHTGNAMSKEEIIKLSYEINIDQLKKYRLAVGRQTEKIVKQLDSAEIDQKVSSSRLDLILQERAVVEDAKGIIDYWSKRTIAGLLLMPPTRHCFIHLNEALRIKKKVMKLRGVLLSP